MAFVIPGALLLLTVLLTVLPWQIGAAFVVGVIGTLLFLTIRWRMQAERSWRQLVYNTQLRAGATPDEAKAKADKARLDWGPIDP
jgi:Flp pilus assembly protein TadB